MASSEDGIGDGGGGAREGDSDPTERRIGKFPSEEPTRTQLSGVGERGIVATAMPDHPPTLTGARAVADNSENPPLHVLIAYDDVAAYRRAMRTLANVFCDQVEADDLRPLPWRFEELSFAVWRRQATVDVSRADMVFVSMSAEGGLPDYVASWLEECFVLRAGQATAVMALCEPRSPEAPCRRFLRRAAVAAGLDYLETAAMPVALAG